MIERCFKAERSEFIALYGRRRVGKTFLVRQYFDNTFDFYVTGIANSNKQTQLLNFHNSLHKHRETASSPPSSWIEAFDQLTRKLNQSQKKKKVIFIDELPWMDTHRSGFISGLEYFWNSWASARTDILLIGCGSAASWMINKLINNKGGLYNRVTERIKLKPFTLSETEQYFEAKNYHIDRYQTIQMYMALGGIPYYLDRIKPQYSVAQNINQLCFADDAPLKNEFQMLFKSLFDSPDNHLEIIKALVQKRIGLPRKEILQKVSIKDGGGFKRALSELESSDFIRSYQSHGKQKRDTIYQLTDPFILFHHQHIKNAKDSNYWLSQLNTPKLLSWQGNAFEIICLLHIAQIKKALGIEGVSAQISAWWGEHAQVDLVIDRQDRVINLVEIKFSINSFEITKKYDEVLRTKVAEFIKHSNTNKAVWLTLVSSFGLSNNKYAGTIQRVITMDALFAEEQAF